MNYDIIQMTAMPNFNRDYYAISKAAELLGSTTDELLHFGYQRRLPIYTIAKNWSGKILDQTYPMEVGEIYKGPDERVLLRDLVQLWPGTLQLFEDGTNEVTLEAILHSPNPVTGKTRQVNLDEAVRIKISQLFVIVDDIKRIIEAKLSDGEHDGEIENGNATSHTDSDNNSPNGLNKRQIAIAFADVYWTEEQWNKNLADYPEWLADALVHKGRPGKGGASIWNPALIAVALQDKTEVNTMKLNRVFSDNPSLHPWAKEWNDTNSPFKDLA